MRVLKRRIPKTHERIKLVKARIARPVVYAGPRRAAPVKIKIPEMIPITREALLPAFTIDHENSCHIHSLSFLGYFFPA